MIGFYSVSRGGHSEESVWKFSYFSKWYILLTVCRIKIALVCAWVLKFCLEVLRTVFHIQVFVCLISLKEFLKCCNRNYISSVDLLQCLHFTDKRITRNSNSKFERVLHCFSNSTRYCTVHSSIPEGTETCASSKNIVMNTCLRVSSVSSQLRVNIEHPLFSILSKYWILYTYSFDTFKKLLWTMDLILTVFYCVQNTDIFLQFSQESFKE